MKISYKHTKNPKRILDFCDIILENELHNNGMMRQAACESDTISYIGLAHNENEAVAAVLICHFHGNWGKYFQADINVFVKEEFRLQGIGRKLVQIARSQNTNKVMKTWRASVCSNHFWSKVDAN